MKAYIYKADLWCQDCGKKVCERLDGEGKRPEDVLDESSYDSDEYPKGPYPNGGGEADCPQNCAGCEIPLENPLTADGYLYLVEMLERSIPPRLRVLAEFYEAKIVAGEESCPIYLS